MQFLFVISLTYSWLPHTEGGPSPPELLDPLIKYIVSALSF